jgi:hypothetical protein
MSGFGSCRGVASDPMTLLMRSDVESHGLSFEPKLPVKKQFSRTKLILVVVAALSLFVVVPAVFWISRGF